MAPSSSRTVKSDTARARHRYDTRFRESDPKLASKELKRKAEAAKVLPPGLREEEDDADWPPKYKKAPPPPKVQKVAARHPRTGRQQRDPTPSVPRPKVNLRISPERAVDLYDEGWRNTTEGDPEVYERRMRMFYEQLKKDRDFSRKKMIQNGLLSDPNKPTTLENAITIVGTCQDMCPLHERVERIVQQMVDKCEKVVHPATGEDVPYEDYMVKRFRRSAAGDDEQLPSDISPPLVLQRTLNYLLEEIVAGPETLSKVHKFVWDRTRAIRNDFSIQQVTEPDDVRVAMDCFERIARFHILALHQLSLPENVENSDFDAHQELEQLSKTLLSLTYYYDDNRGTVTSPNEAEFRAYSIMIEIGYPRPRLEQRANIWDKHVLEDQQVQMALSLYAMCGGIGDGEGPWFRGTSFEVGRGNPRSFFPFLKSPKVPYLLACVAEISFYHIRGLILESVWNEFKDGNANSRQMKDWFVEDVRAILGFDDVDQATGFCSSHGLSMKIVKGNKRVLDLEGSHFQREHRRSYPQVFSNRIVEDKRAFRTYLETINGLWAPQEGIEEALDDLEASVREAYEPLFVSDGSDEGEMDTSSAQDALGATNQKSSSNTELPSTPNSSRGFPNSDALSHASSFGKPTPISLPAFQNQGKSTTSQLSANFGEPGNTPKPNPSTSSLAAGQEQSPFSQADSVDSPNLPKTKTQFSAPPGKWQFPKDVIAKHATKLASPASSTPNMSEVSSPQGSSGNKIAQPVPFASSSFFNNSLPNPFSQAPHGNTDGQSAPSANSHLIQTAPRNPFSQASSKDANAQSASPAYLDLSKSVSPNPFSRISSENTKAPELASPQPLPLSSILQPSSGSVSKSPTNNNSSWPTVSPFYGSFNLVFFNNPAGISSLPTWEQLFSFQKSSIQARPQNSYPVFAASPFSGSFNGVDFSNPQAAASLPTWAKSSTNQNTPIVTSIPQTASWAVSSAPSTSGFFASPLPSSNQLEVPSLPASTTPSASLNSPGLSTSFAMTSSSVFSQPGSLSTNEPTKSSTKPPSQMPFSFSDQPTKLSSTPEITPFSFSNPPPKPFSTPGANPSSFLDSPTKPASAPSTMPFSTSSPSSKSPFDISKPLSSVSKLATSFSPLLNAPPLSSGEPEKSPLVVEKAPLVFDQLEKSTSSLKSAPPLTSGEPEKAPSAGKQGSLSFDQPEKSTSKLQNAPPLSNQPDKSASATQNATWTFNKLEKPSQLHKVPSSSFRPGQPLSILPVVNDTLIQATAPTPTPQETSSAAPNTTILTMETSQTPAVTLTSPIDENSKEVPTSAPDMPITSSTSNSFSSIKLPKDASSQGSSLKDKASSLVSTSPAKKFSPPNSSIIQSTQQAETDPSQNGRRAERLDVLSKGVMLDKGGLLDQFVDFHMSKIIRESFEQVETERSQKEADEYRVMALSKKYIKKWRTIAWKKGLMRRAPERRRRFAQSLQQMARDTARQKEDLVASLLSRKSENEDQQAELAVSTDSILTRSTASKKRKSSDGENQSTPNRMSRNKRSRLDQVEKEHETPSRRIISGHKRSRTAENPKLSETEELINTLLATRDDYTYLANGSESSYKIMQKIRTLLPPVKVDDTRSDYFMLKSLGIDPDTPVVPRTSRKRHSSDDILSNPSKRFKESPLTKSASALTPPSNRPRSRSPSPLRKSHQQYRDRSVTAQSADFDETENDVLAVQRESNNKMTDVGKLYREQRAKWGSGRISSNSSTTPSRSIEYYKEQRAKWGTPAPSRAVDLRQFTSAKIKEVLQAASERYSGQSTGSKQDTKSGIRAAIDQRQRDSYATLQRGAERNEGGIVQLPSLAAGGARTAAAPAGSSAEAAIEL